MFGTPLWNFQFYNFPLWLSFPLWNGRLTIVTGRFTIETCLLNYTSLDGQVYSLVATMDFLQWRASGVSCGKLRQNCHLEGLAFPHHMVRRFLRIQWLRKTKLNCLILCSISFVCSWFVNRKCSISLCLSQAPESNHQPSVQVWRPSSPVKNESTPNRQTNTTKKVANVSQTLEQVWLPTSPV